MGLRARVKWDRYVRGVRESLTDADWCEGSQDRLTDRTGVYGDMLRRRDMGTGDLGVRLGTVVWDAALDLPCHGPSGEDVAWVWAMVAQAALECEVEGLRRVLVGIHQFATGAIE